MYFCDECNKNVNTEIRELRSIFDVKGEKIEASIQIRVCTSCKNEVWDRELELQNQISIYSIYRKKMGLLEPFEIKSIRERTGLSQQSFARLLGFGDKTITRYENGSIQDDSHDLLIRMCENDTTFLSIYHQRKHALTVRDIAKVERKYIASMNYSTPA